MKRNWREIPLALRLLLCFFVVVGLLRVFVFIIGPNPLSDPRTLTKLLGGVIYLGGGGIALLGRRSGLTILIYFNYFVLLLLGSALIKQGPAAVGLSGAALGAYGLFCVYFLSDARRNWMLPAGATTPQPGSARTQ